MYKVLAALLTIAHDVEACVFLLFDPQQGRIGLGLLQLRAGQLPLRPELFGLRQPGGFWQTASDSGFKHG